MDFSAALHPEIQQALARGATVLTANQRAARTLRRAFDLHQCSSGRTHWQPPSILAWDTWLTSLWRSLLLDGHATQLLLSPTQEHTLWRDLVAPDTAATSLQPADALAETAAGAWLLLHAYCGRHRLRNYAGNTDTKVFARWAAAFERRCDHAGYLTQAQLPGTLRAAIAAGHIALPSGLLLVGFDSQTPAQSALLDAVQAAGTVIESLAPASPAPACTLVTAPTEHDELAACARWLRTRLTQQPAARLAVIVPAIETCRPAMDRVFRHILAPELADIAAPTGSSPYEFSLGIPLAHTPIAACALHVLRWAGAPLPLSSVSALLLSPHFAASPSEYLARAEFDAFAVRNLHLLQPQISCEGLHRIVARSSQARSLPILLHSLAALRTLTSNKVLATAKRSYAEWTTTIHELLQAAAWAPLSQLDSIEFQTRRKWESALDELATLDFEGDRVTFPDALAALERIASNTLFAPESCHAPVQIVGPLESAGSTFDAVWFLHANDIAWPTRPAPNPLLPWPLQRDLGMPGCDPTLDFAHARRITERIAASAPTVLFSYAAESADGSQRPSPALSSLALETLRAAVEPAPAPVLLDTLPDSTPIPPPPDSILQGGAAILQAQAACGFRAFAEKRLFASALDGASLGLDARERGSLVHTVLEKFWAQVQTQAALKALPTAERDALLARCIESTLDDFPAAVEPGWPRAYVTTERQRLLNLLRPWLDFEANVRPPFTVKAREETLRNVTIGPLHLNIRVDRVDTAIVGGEPSGEIILDYKTGDARPAQWLGDRPDAPQLPLYAVVSDIPHLAGVAFANVRPGTGLGLKGYAASAGILPKASKLQADSLDTQVRQWRNVLTTLADQFHSGDARVQPKRYPQTCQYCQQRLLCRLNPDTLDTPDDPDDPDPSDQQFREAELG
jgi:probable DNA repair protein